MQKAIFTLLIVFSAGIVRAQVSFQNPEEPKTLKKAEADPAAKKALQKKLNSITGLDSVSNKAVLFHDSVYTKIKNNIDSIVKLYKQKRLFLLLQDTVEDKKSLVAELIKKRDSLVNDQKKLKQLVDYWHRYDRFEEPKQIQNFFPAYYSTQAIKFFEGDSIHLKLFQNNLINYNPGSKKMTLFTEVVNDYLGPIRVGIGFQIASDAKTDSLKTVDSTQKLEKKADMLSAIQNGGGDISINLKYPVIKSANTGAALQYKFYLYANTGFSLPVLNKASTDFLFNYNGGLEGVLYSRGFNNRLTFYSQMRAAYYNGNKNYKKVITDADENDPASFVMFQTSFGIDFLDGYRLSVDLFHGNSFIRKNFPATITFIVRPGKKNEGNSD